MNIEDLTHEQLATEAIHTGKTREDDNLVDAGRTLQTLVDAEADSMTQAGVVLELLRTP